MSKIDYNVLREAAEAAKGKTTWQDLQAFHAAATPEVVLAMLDVLDASLEAEPVMFCISGQNVDSEEHVSTSKAVVDAWVEEWNQVDGSPGEPLYKTMPLYCHAAPPALVVPHEWRLSNAQAFIERYSPPSVEEAALFAWNACRAAMLHAGNFRENKNSSTNNFREIPETSTNSPVTPDGWIRCSERMPEKNQNVLISVNFDSSLVEPLICSARYTGSTFRRGDATIKPGNGIEQATHWMPLPEPPQEVK